MKITHRVLLLFFCVPLGLTTSCSEEAQLAEQCETQSSCETTTETKTNWASAGGIGAGVLALGALAGGGGGSSSSGGSESSSSSTETTDTSNTADSAGTDTTTDTTTAFTMKPTTQFCKDICDGLVAYYPFFGNANDTSGNGFDGEFPAGATISDYFINDRDNNSDSSYRFESGNILIKDLIDRELLATSYTISSIVKINQLKTDYRLNDVGDPWFSSLKFLDSNSFRMHIFFWPDLTQSFSIGLNYNTEGVFAHNYNGIKYNHIAVTFDKDINLFQIYINGKLSLSSALNATLSSSGDIKIRGEWFGSMDELRFYNRALSESEIQQIIGQ